MREYLPHSDLPGPAVMINTSCMSQTELREAVVGNERCWAAEDFMCVLTFQYGSSYSQNQTQNNDPTHDKRQRHVKGRMGQCHKHQTGVFIDLEGPTRAHQSESHF